MFSSHGMTRRELLQARGCLVRAIAREAPGTISDWNATCHRRCPSAEQLIAAPFPLLTVQTVLMRKKFLRCFWEA
jgi:hypothetical protein